jgi:hypothetical protein
MTNSFEDAAKKEFLALLDIRIAECLMTLEQITHALVYANSLRTEPEEFKVAFGEFLKSKKHKEVHRR